MALNLEDREAIDFALCAKIKEKRKAYDSVPKDSEQAGIFLGDLGWYETALKNFRAEYKIK